MSGIGIHGHWVHGEVRNQKRLPVFEAAATPDLLRHSEQSCNPTATKDGGHQRRTRRTQSNQITVPRLALRSLKEGSPHKYLFSFLPVVLFTSR